MSFKKDIESRFKIFAEGGNLGFMHEVGIVDFADGSKKVVLKDISRFLVTQINKFVIRAYPRNMDDIFIVGQIVDILKRSSYSHIRDITLELNTTLYTRYDRVMHSDRSDAFGLKVYVNVLASFGITRIRTLDAHSDVFGLLVKDAGMEYEDTSIIEAVTDTLSGDGNFVYQNFSKIQGDFIIVAPDKGLKSKVGNRADITCDKARDPVTGRIQGVKVVDGGQYCTYDESGKKFEFNPSENPWGKSILIIDDICERGGTFFGVAQALRDIGYEGHINLAVTHGIMPEGTNFETMAQTFDNVFVNTMHVSRVYEAENQIKGNGGSFFCKHIYK